MRSMLRSLVLTSAALFATAAFAADKAVVTVPFNFDSHGRAFPAGQYQVGVDASTNVITMSSMDDPAQKVMWTARSADYVSGSPILRMKFVADGDSYELRSVQVARRITPLLDAPAKHHGAGSYVATVIGQ